jgi:outer membrane biosynthesis protein TonB
MLAGSASLAVHGVVVSLVVVLVGKRVASPPPAASLLTLVEVIDAAPGPPALPPKGTSPTAPPTPTVKKVARAARPQVQRSQSSAPAAPESLADLTIGYDDPNNFAAKGPSRLDNAGDTPQRGISTGIQNQSGGSVATMNIPQPKVVSLARPPRPKGDYSRLRLAGASKFAGRMIRVVLTVGPSGRVRGVRLLQGVDRDLDRRTLTLIGNFEFEPALDDDGVAVRADMPCNIEIVEDEDNVPFQSMYELIRR